MSIGIPPPTQILFGILRGQWHWQSMLLTTSGKPCLCKPQDLWAKPQTVRGANADKGFENILVLL